MARARVVCFRQVHPVCPLYGDSDKRLKWHNNDPDSRTRALGRYVSVLTKQTILETSAKHTLSLQLRTWMRSKTYRAWHRFSQQCEACRALSHDTCALQDVMAFHCQHYSQHSVNTTVNTTVNTPKTLEIKHRGIYTLLGQKE